MKAELFNYRKGREGNFLFLIIIITSVIVFFSPNKEYCQPAFSVKNNNDSSYIYVNNSGAVAIDTSSTSGSLTIGGNNGIIATGTDGLGKALSLGAGTRMMWYPQKAAFRAGEIGVGGTEWDDPNIRQDSFASGYNTTASGDYSTAMGALTIASGPISTAIGRLTTASGVYSTAMGDFATASGDYSTAIGYTATASGNYSTAIGSGVNTNGKSGSFIIGDSTAPGIPTAISNAANQMMMRFGGGYIFYTSDDRTTGAVLNHGQNTWSTVSDSTKKYAFLPVNGESVLKKIDKFNLRTWSYKGQDSSKFRHYGPMAQEFFTAFGHDKYGVAGNDTTINQADFEGILLVAVQTLKRENKKEDLKIRSQESEISKLGNELKKQKNEIISEQAQIKKLDKMKIEFSKFKKAMASFIDKSNSSKTKIAMGTN